MPRPSSDETIMSDKFPKVSKIFGDSIANLENLAKFAAEFLKPGDSNIKKSENNASHYNIIGNIITFAILLLRREQGRAATRVPPSPHAAQQDTQDKYLTYNNE